MFFVKFPAVGLQHSTVDNIQKTNSPLNFLSPKNIGESIFKIQRETTAHAKSDHYLSSVSNKLFSGLMLGATPSYVIDISPKRLRLSFMRMHDILIAVGIFFAQVCKQQRTVPIAMKT